MNLQPQPFPDRWIREMGGVCMVPLKKIKNTHGGKKNRLLKITCYLYKKKNVSSIYKFGLSVCLFVWLYPINVKTAEPIGPKFFVGHHVTTGKVYE